MSALPGGETLFRKIRGSRPGDARREWENLEALDALGFCVPRPVFLALRAQDSALAMLGVPGRPLDALLREALAESREEELGAYLISQVAPLVRRLHASGWFYRDLYWNHLFACGLEAEGAEPALIDVERAFRPHWRRARWRLKDLAGLLASWPESELQRPKLALRFLRAYLGGEKGEARVLLRRVAKKARQIRAHRPRYG